MISAITSSCCRIILHILTFIRLSGKHDSYVETRSRNWLMQQLPVIGAPLVGGRNNVHPIKRIDTNQVFIFLNPLQQLVCSIFSVLVKGDRRAVL